ncbi:hypothetical protein VOLCADRAFT_104829 [Volvox carteri f. nagariensis]|uniref:Diphthamide biosynthesis protein 3 n=1 Tax=Volvox carteri f. nagariensis TaxID=3068 RepID=D8TWB8_VOLCA|nr:uncharacterized protein VOLCADRAFT_104829 [Volvox carteri f. nagariensis]EFJ48017.1 hypothetical protein VOLCADRAFT_104829 [Volvox carteri f. nagariensis]|eukprot:XP_002950702.1 hypothetical protein VOLCADRAFT_104829 [Volvox carteri f. nagariensis]
MSYDEVEIEDMTWNEKLQAYTYPCPCGDLFQITKEELRAGEEIARCPSCSLYITVVYDPLSSREQLSLRLGVGPGPGYFGVFMVEWRLNTHLTTYSHFLI